MFGLFGEKARQRSLELAGSLSNFYADDQRMIELFQETLQLAEEAIKEVEDALGPPGISNPYNVPLAAEICGRTRRSSISLRRSSTVWRTS
jgi:hypothetical protein